MPPWINMDKEKLTTLMTQLTFNSLPPIGSGPLMLPPHFRCPFRCPFPLQLFQMVISDFVSCLLKCYHLLSILLADNLPSFSLKKKKCKQPNENFHITHHPLCTHILYLPLCSQRDKLFMTQHIPTASTGSHPSRLPKKPIPPDACMPNSVTFCSNVTFSVGLLWHTIKY